MTPSGSMAKETETSIIVAGTHTHSVATIIECNQWSDHDIEITRRYSVATVFRFPDAVSIPHECRVGCETDEAHNASRTDDGDEYGSARAECMGDEASDIYLERRGKVDSDAPRRVIQRAPADMALYLRGGIIARLITQTFAHAASGTATICTAIAHQIGRFTANGGKVAPPACAVTSRRSRTRA